MRLFRSEEDVEAWCAERGLTPGATLPVAQLQALAEAWYGDRLYPSWRPRSRGASQEILAAHGLTGDFWTLP